jgi:hypothetical protein
MARLEISSTVVLMLLSPALYGTRREKKRYAPGSSYLTRYSTTLRPKQFLARSTTTQDIEVAILALDSGELALLMINCALRLEMIFFLVVFQVLLVPHPTQSCVVAEVRGSHHVRPREGQVRDYMLPTEPVIRRCPQVLARCSGY